MNRRHRGYEPRELSNCSIPQYRIRESNSRPPGPKLSQSGICSRHAAAILQVTGLQEKRMLSSYAVTLSVKRPHRGLNPESPDRQSGGISNYPMRPLYILACASSIYPQIYTRILLAIKRKPNGQGEIRTHNVSSVTVLQTACFSHFAYLP